MTTTTEQLPTRRSDLIIKPIGDDGRYVVKNPQSREFFQIGEEEYFLLNQLDGKNDAAAVCAGFEETFGEPLSTDDLDGFLEMARGQQLLASAELGTRSAERSSDENNPHSELRTPQSKQSLLYWRKSVFDPDRFFTWLEPKIRFCWTRAFLVFSAGCIALAVIVLWTNGQQAASSFTHALRWETVFFAWLTMLAIGMLHEFAHGLTCKHYGGEVREIGFLLMYFMPCFYCNVSDAWLFRERSKRLWVTLAGGYFELFLWALAVFVWRLTMPDTMINYLAFIVLTLSGIDSFFNFNPLIKLDGYYLLSDWMEIPNLRQRSFEYAGAHARRILWGGPRPESPSTDPGNKGRTKSRFLLGFGLTSWFYSVTFISLMLAGLYHWSHDSLGMLSLPIIGLLGVVSTRGLLGNMFRGGFTNMIFKRHLRTAVWVLLLVGSGGASFLIPWTDYASADFEVRAETRAELRAPVAGFLESVHYEEGQRISPDCVIAHLKIPDLESRIIRKQAELGEAQAKLKLLEAGPRAEEITQQKLRLAAAEAWRDVAARNLRQQKQVLKQELIRFDKLLQEYSAECNYAEQVLARYEKLRSRGALTEDEYGTGRKLYLVACARCERTEAEQRSRAAQGTLAAESELAEREKELAYERSALALLEAGSRPEEIEAAQATVTRLREEISYLKATNDRLAIHSPLAGVITTDRLKQKIGDFFEEGELICEVEDSRQLEIVIALDEDQAARVRLGQRVRLKARSLPFEVFDVEVVRIAPQAEKGEVQSQVNIYCRLHDPDGKLRSGMTGYARIDCGHAPIASVFSEKCLRFIRTEFWW